MSHLLWKYYWENDVDRFRRLLATAGPKKSHSASRIPAVGAGSAPLSTPGSSPRPSTRFRRTLGHSPASGKSREANTALTRSDVNSRDHAGLTLLLRAASSTDPNAIAFVQALIDHPSIDLYAQDPESGWNSLHRALYSGNISIARMLLFKERADLTSHTVSSIHKVGQLIKTKDHEGNSPFDLYNSTIAARSLRQLEDDTVGEDGSESGETIGDMAQTPTKLSHLNKLSVLGDELFVFGSNKNLSLGVGDEDDRQYPERILLQRQDQLLHRLHDQYLQKQSMNPPAGGPELDSIPTLVRNAPLIVQDVVMSKLHSAILTGDPVSNLYVSGVGRGGRLGFGDENTQFRFMPLQGPLADKKVWQVALGQNHSMAIAGNGELWAWGLNTDSQLGYVLPPPLRADEDPMSLIPRQVFGPLKKEIILGIAASAIHSVAHTGSSLYCWGRNVGQLGLMDADSRSLDIQQTPRKVAASLLSAPIEMVSAIDKATTCLLSNCTVWVFTNYGYNLIKFPFPDMLSNHKLASSTVVTRYDPAGRDIDYITSGGETIAAVTKGGDLFTMRLKGDNGVPAGSTTNPVKIKGAVTQPQCIWRSRKDGVASVSVGEHGSVIICTESGAVWKRIKRAKGKITGPADASDAKQKDFKFQRIPYITGCVAVRSSTFGAFATIRKDCKVMTEEIGLPPQSLWDDIGSLLCLEDFSATQAANAGGSTRTAWTKAIEREKPGSLAHRILSCADIEAELTPWLQYNAPQYDVDMEIRTTSALDIRIPVHGWLMAGRSSVLRTMLSEFRRCQGSVSFADMCVLEEIGDKIVLTIQQVDIFTILNVVLYAYQDAVIPVWKYTRENPPMAHRFRQVRTELMKVATKLNLVKLEAAARLQATPDRCLDKDLQTAINDPLYFEDGDTILELDGGEVVVHSQLLCRRCPFFDGMFYGRSQGQWLAGRRDSDRIRIDLKHIRPETFHYVISFLYGDVGAELFGEVTIGTLDEFCELVMDVLSVANELMIDGLSQICQASIGKFVTTRNIATLLNEISPCSVSEFKDTGLEYICLQLESMLENHLLDVLDEELLRELDGKVRDNQMACMPFAKSGRAELLLHETYPSLVLDIEEERQSRAREMAFRQAQRDEERKAYLTPKSRFASFGESVRSPETAERGESQGQSSQNGSRSALRSKESHGDGMFAEEEVLQRTSSVNSPQMTSPEPLLGLGAELLLLSSGPIWKGKDKAQMPFSAQLQTTPADSSAPPDEEGSRAYDWKKPGVPWASSVLNTKSDMRDIISEASSKSSLSPALAAQAATDGGRPQTKVSQKERKRQMQMQLEARSGSQEPTKTPWETTSGGKKTPVPAWKSAEPIPKTSLLEAMLGEETQSTQSTQGAQGAQGSARRQAVSAGAKPLVASESDPQTQRRTASPDTRFPGQGRSRTPNEVPVPHSKLYIQPTPRAETWLGASMVDIIGQQRRERELVKEAVAKRSLQDIQQEQAFQEWWDQESRRTQEEEAERMAKRDKEETARRSRRNRGGKGRAEGTSKEMSREGPREAGVGGSARDRGKGRAGGRS